MNFYQSAFPKNVLENIGKKARFWGNYPSIFTLSGQSYDSKKFFYMKTNVQQICRVTKKSKHSILVVFLLETW